jgi:hypothetical protein
MVTREILDYATLAAAPLFHDVRVSIEMSSAAAGVDVACFNDDSFNAITTSPASRVVFCGRRAQPLRK